jgi:DNA-binding IclR family transcriptional regulator
MRRVPATDMRNQVSTNESGSVGTLARGLDVLELFAREGRELSQKEISDALGLPMPTTHRLTQLLTERGWLERDAATRRLRLGLKVAHLMPALLGGLRLPDVARPHLLRLVAELNETINLAVLEGAEIVYLLSESADRLLTTRAAVGSRLPSHCTALGKCLLAGLPPEVARAALGSEPYERRTERTLTSWETLAPDLAAIRAAGVAVSEGEYEAGLVSISVPVSWVGGSGAAAINVSLPDVRATPAFRKKLTDQLLLSAQAIDREMFPNTEG